MAASLQSNLQELFEAAVADGLAHGFQYVVFNKDCFIASGATGLAKIPSDKLSFGEPMKPDNVFWLASAGKVSISLLVLMILERGLAFNNMDLNDIDSSDKLAQVLPEFRLGSGHLVTKIIEGFESFPGPDGRRVPILRDVTTPLTLRMLLTHTGGLSYNFLDDLVVKYFQPSEFGGPPLKHHPGTTGLIDDFTVPLINEPGERVTYGYHTDWLGLFAVRATGRNLRDLLNDTLFERLGIPSSECDVALTTVISKKLVDTVIYNPVQGEPFIKVTVPRYSCEGDPAPGYQHYASAPMWSSIRAYSTLLQAILRHDGRLLSEKTWQMAVEDQFEHIGVRVSKPRWRSNNHLNSLDIDAFSEPLDYEDRASMNLLQWEVNTGPSVTGRPTGTYGWGGVANTYYAIDEQNGVGWVYSTQVFPFFLPKLVQLRDDMEKLIYRSLSTFKS